jgi:hypothetical protein
MARYTDQQLQDKILNELEWYEEKSQNATIDDLLTFQDRVSIMSVYLAKIAAVQKGCYLRAYFNRKLDFSTAKLRHIELKNTAAKSEELANIDIQSAKLKEIESEQAAYIIELELKQINKVLSACQQRISFEKSEKERNDKLSSYSKTQS